MDLISNSTATSSVNDENSKEKIPSKRDIFFSTYQPHQPWALPDSIIYYISKNPSTTKVYQKLIQSCKYFFVTNPILVFPRFNLRYQWKTFFNGKEINLKNINCKIWVTDYICCSNNAKNADDQYFSTSILPKIFQSDAKDIFLHNQNIAFNDLIFLASKCERADLVNVNVMEKNGCAIVVEKLFEAFPVVKVFSFDAFSVAAVNAIAITTKTVAKLIKSPHFVNLVNFELRCIPECFDIDTFYSYIKKNKKTQIRLIFARNISQQYRNRLQIIVNEIIQVKDRDYRPPYIDYPGMDGTSHNKLWNLSCR